MALLPRPAFFPTVFVPFFPLVSQMLTRCRPLGHRSSLCLQRDQESWKLHISSDNAFLGFVGCTLLRTPSTLHPIVFFVITFWLGRRWRWWRLHNFAHKTLFLLLIGFGTESPVEDVLSGSPRSSTSSFSDLRLLPRLRSFCQPSSCLSFRNRRTSLPREDQVQLQEEEVAEQDSSSIAPFLPFFLSFFALAVPQAEKPSSSLVSRLNLSSSFFSSTTAPFLLVLFVDSREAPSIIGTFRFAQIFV